MTFMKAKKECRNPYTTSRRTYPCRGRGVVSRAASVLMFALAGVAVFVFPEGEAEGVSSAGGFAPAQVPVSGLLGADNYRPPTLCTDLGGTLQEVEGEWVCQNLDRSGTFCIVGSANVFPCRGLFRHVIQCNDDYNRPALNPFICDIVCKAPGAPWEVKARGPNCEFVQTADEILPEAARTINLPNLPDGHTGAIATLQVSNLEFQGTTYEKYSLINHRPLGPGVDNPQTADQLTIAAGNILGVPEYAPLQTGETSRTLTAKNSCPEVPGGAGFRGSADLGCYPVFVTIVANFQQVVRRTDIVLNSVAANLPAAAVTLETAVGHSGFGYGISLTNTMVYALVDIAYDTDAHGFDPDNGIILLDTPLQAGAPITAEVEADIECRTIPFCNPARISVTVVFEPVAAPAQADAGAPLTSPFILNLAVALPEGYAANPVENATAANLTLAGVAGYDGDFATVFAVDNNGNIVNENNRAAEVLPGNYVFTVLMTAEDMLGTLALEVPLNLYPANQIPPSQSIPVNQREIFQAIASGYSGSIAYFQAADSTVGLSTPGPDADDSPPFSVSSESVSRPVFPPDGITLVYNPDPANTPAPGETRAATLSFRSEKMSGNESSEEDFAVVVAVSVVFVPPQETLEIDANEDFAHPLVVPGFDLSGGNFIVSSVHNTAADEEYSSGDKVFAVEDGILRRNRTGDNPRPPEAGRYDVIVEMTHPDIRGAVAITVGVSVAREEVLVFYASVPADGTRGTLSADGLEGEGAALLGSTVTFTAAPAEFNYVAGWSSPRCSPGGRFVSENVECALVATTAISLSAEFRPLARRIEVSPAPALGALSASSGGSVLVEGAEVPHGARVTFTAAPKRAGEGLFYVSSWTRERFGGGGAEAVCERKIGGVSNTTLKRCALTADRDMRVAAAFDLARERLDFRLSIAVLDEEPFDAELVGLLLTLGADANQTSADGEALLLRAARQDKGLAVSILITAGADPEARSPTSERQVAHWAARDRRLEVLRYYIAAVGRVGRSHGWNNNDADSETALGVFQSLHGGDREAAAREFAALIYERGGRCGGRSGTHCDVPVEERAAVIAEDARGDVLTIVARDFGGAEFDLSLPETEALTVLASIGWALRLDEAERPRRAVLERRETTSKRAAVFTITAQYGGADVRRYVVSARLEGAETDPDAALAAEVAKDSPNLARIAELLEQGANVNQTDDSGEALLLQMAETGRHLAVSILISAGADPYARTPTENYQVPHLAARHLHVEVMRHYLAAVSFNDWNTSTTPLDLTPLDLVQSLHGTSRDGRTREIAALIYERGGRCVRLGSGFYCNAPLEERNLLTPDAPGDVYTIVARDLGATRFDLTLPGEDALTVLASTGWGLRLEKARPQRAVLERAVTTLTASAVFTITARNGGTLARRYKVSARPSVVADDPSAALVAELSEASPNAPWVAELFRQGATLAPAQADEAGALMLQAARNNNPLLVSVLITAGANADARLPGVDDRRQVPHLAARNLLLEVLRHYIAAIGQVGHAYDWNSTAGPWTPLEILQNWNGDDGSERTREIAALIYERGGRCAWVALYCNNVPSEERDAVIADDAQGDVLTIVARDFGAARFTLSLPETEALTALASVGWTLRVDEAERPRRVVLERGGTTRKVAAVFTITARNGSEDVRRYMVSARLAGAEANPDAALAAEVAKDSPNPARIAELLDQGANVNQTDDNGEALLLQMAKTGRHSAVSILITLGANPEARSPTTNRQVPHWAARDGRLEVLRYYIAAVGHVGYSYDWNDSADAGTPLGMFQSSHGSDRSAAAREFAALVYERGGRCGGQSGTHCDVPMEERNTVIADDARGDVLTIVARDFGAAEFTLSLPEAEALTVLASIGWTLRLEAGERPRRAVLERGETTRLAAAVFTITAQYGGADVRRYVVSARLEGAEADPDAALAAEIAKNAPNLARIVELLNQGATVNQTSDEADPDAALAAEVAKDAPNFARVVELLDQGADVNQTDDYGEALLLRMAKTGRHLAVSILINAGADPEAQSPTNMRQVPHWAARNLHLEVLRHYIAAIGQRGHSYEWNFRAFGPVYAKTPLQEVLETGSAGAAAREIAALIYERGGRCSVPPEMFFECNIPSENLNRVIADDASGDVFTIVARDFGAAKFDLSLPEADELTVLAGIGLSLRLETERPQRIVAARNQMTMTMAAVFTITARSDGVDVRHYIISAGVEGASGLAPDNLRIANLPKNPVLSRSGVEPPTGTIHPRESRGTTDRKQELMSWRLSGFGIAWEYLAGVDRSELVPVLVPVGG